MRVSIHRKVPREVSEAMEWYEKRRDGLGDPFYVEVEKTIDRIAANPMHFPFWKEVARTRKASLRRFPHGVIFIHEAHGVRHNKRHQSYRSNRA